MTEHNPNLVAAFHRHAAAHPERPALAAAGRVYGYGELAAMAQQVAALVSGGARVGILASRSLEAYAGVLGTLWAGAAYVPIHPNTPDERLIHILNATALDALVADAAGLERLRGRVAEAAPRLVIGAAGFCGATFREDAAPAEVRGEDLAYILFTSGTTGVPKGVMVETGSVARFLDAVRRRFPFDAGDRFAQAAELTFDLSVFEMFAAWSVGAAVHVVPAPQVLAPGKFLRDHEVAVWFAVPSIAMFMQRLGMLAPGMYPRLRYLPLGGEAVPVSLAVASQAAAPHAVVENLYGPTEVTVTAAAHSLTDAPLTTRGRGMLAIGQPLDGVEAEIVDAELQPVAGTASGELLLAGRQLARGYLGDPEMTAARFPVLRGKRWYRTGDLVCRDEDGTLHHLGRIDNQVKILGNRVELEEVEAHLRAVSGTDQVAAVAWPVTDGHASGISAFVCGGELDGQVLREALRRRVPPYMVPGRVLRVERLPLGTTGKVDRIALLRLLQAEAAELDE